MFSEINKDDETICYKGVHKILKQFESKKTEVFKTSVKLFLTALETLRWKETDTYVQNCCKAIHIWFNTTYGEVANVSRMDSELQVLFINTTVIHNVIIIFSRTGITSYSWSIQRA